MRKPNITTIKQKKEIRKHEKKNVDLKENMKRMKETEQTFKEMETKEKIIHTIGQGRLCI